MPDSRKVHLQYTGSGYTDVGICHPWDGRSRRVTTDEDEVTCELCKLFLPYERPHK